MEHAANLPAVAGIDLCDHDRFARGVPHEWFARLRAEAPVYWQPEPKGPGFWSITRHEDVVRVSKDPKRFSSEVGGTSLEDLEPEHVEARKSMIDMDPPRHYKLRALINKRFLPRALKAFSDHIRQLFRGILESAIARGDFDFVDDVAVELPMRVFAEMLGAPQEDRRLIVDIGNRILGATDPEYVDDYETERERFKHLPFSSPASLEMFEYGRKLAAARRAEPRDDIVTDLVFAEVDGEPLTPHEFDLYFLLLAAAGNETTRHSLSGGMHELLRHPDQAQRVVAGDEDLATTAADEILRMVTAVHHFRRTATEDVEMRGEVIRAGDKVAMWYTSANRDEDVFEDPHRFDVGRKPNRHLTFGIGPHFCLGAYLARLEIRIALEELRPHLDRLELVSEPERLRSNFFNGIKHMGVRYR